MQKKEGLMRVVGLFLSLLPSILTLSQPRELKLITYDFSIKQFEDKSWKKLQSMKRGDVYQIEVKNVNQNIWNVHLNTKEIKDTNKLSFTTLFDGLNLTSLTTLVGGLTPTGNVLAPLLAMDPQHRPEIKKMIPDDLIALMIETQDTLTDHYLLIRKFMAELDSFSIELGGSLLRYTSVRRNISNQLSLSNPDITMIKSWFYKKRKEINGHQTSMNQIINMYRPSFASLIEQVDSADLKAALNKASELIVKYYDDLNRSYDHMAMDLGDSICLSILKQIVTLENHPSKWQSGILTFPGLYGTIDLKIAPRDTSSGLQSFHNFVKLPVKKSIAGYSSGFFISNLGSQAYSVRTLPDSLFSLESENARKIEIGFSAMFRYVLNNTSKVGWHFGFGPGISYTDKIRPRLLAGGGLAFGLDHRFLLDLGVIIGQRDVLSKAYDSSSTYEETPSGFLVSKTEVRFPYVSLAYRLDP